MSNINSVTVRPILPNELEAVANIRAISFGVNQKQALDRLKNSPRYSSAQLIVAEAEGEIIGTGTIFPTEMWLSGVPLKIGAVAGLAVLPKYRRNGVAAKIMNFAIERMAAEGQALSILFPFSHKYYNAFGYGAIGDLHAYRISPHNLSAYEEGRKVRPFELSDLRMMQVMYKGQMTWRNGWFTRSADWWDDIIRRWPQIMVFDNDGFIEGYYSYNLKTNEQGERVLYIHELFVAEDAAYRGLVGYLAAQDEADVIEYLAPPDTPLRHMLRQPVAADAENRSWIFNDLCHITTGPMGRIINLPGALTTRFYTRGLSGERVLKVSDPLLPSNEEAIVFRIVDGRAETRAGDGKKPDVETDIGTLSQILTGYLTARDARLLGRFKTDEDTCSWLDQAIADSPLFIQAGDWF